MSKSPSANPNIPQIQEPATNLPHLTTVVRSLKQGVESLGGYRGNPLDRAVTYRDLIALGLITADLQLPP